MTAAVAMGLRIADVMVTCPKTHCPECGLQAIRDFFEDDHVHMALIVAPDGRLVTAIERQDLTAVTANSATVAGLGTLVGRTARPADPLTAATARLMREERRRLAVLDDSGRLIGLLCLKGNGAGYCADDGRRARRELVCRRGDG